MGMTCSVAQSVFECYTEEWERISLSNGHFFGPLVVGDHTYILSLSPVV